MDARVKRLFEATAAGNINLMNELINQGIDVNTKNPFGDTPLHIAAQQQFCPETVKTLLRGGGDPNIQNDKMQTPMHFSRTPTNFETLINFGGNPKAIDKYSNTPLHTIIRRGAKPSLLTDMVLILMRSGADPFFENVDGKSAINDAEDRSMTQIIQTIKMEIQRKTLRNIINTQIYSPKRNNAL